VLQNNPTTMSAEVVQDMGQKLLKLTPLGFTIQHSVCHDYGDVQFVLCPPIYHTRGPKKGSSHGTLGLGPMATPMDPLAKAIDFPPNPSESVAKSIILHKLCFRVTLSQEMIT
jgi:hypothetical protein